MNNQLLDQINLWWKAVSDKEAFNNYQKTIQATWNILRETAKLLWLFLCLGFILVAWLGTFSKQSGQQLKTWYDGIPDPKSENVWAQVGQFLTTTGQSTATQALNQARTQLGLPVLEKRPAAQPIAAEKPKAAAPAKIESAAPVPAATEAQAEEAS